MNKSIDAAGADWPALRRRFAGEALANVLAFCGWQAETREWAGGDPGARTGEDTASRLTAQSCGKCVPLAHTVPRRAVRLQTESGFLHLKVGPVTPLWRGEPLEENGPPDWPRRTAPDAARFFLTARPLAEPVTLDCDLAAQRDEHNPYYFTCYIHKRLCALLSRGSPEGLSGPAAFTEEERVLALAVDRFPAAVRRGSEALDPYFVNRYAVELAGEVWRFLRACPSTGETRPLLAAAETALGNALSILMVVRGQRRICPVRQTIQALACQLHTFQIFSL